MRQFKIIALFISAIATHKLDAIAANKLDTSFDPIKKVQEPF